ncbi:MULTISPECIES: hypothetical protein [Methanobacterium]|nr:MULTISPECIES: hypothetical protein [Methanobacterium]
MGSNPTPCTIFLMKVSTKPTRQRSTAVDSYNQILPDLRTFT